MATTHSMSYVDTISTSIVVAESRCVLRHRLPQKSSQGLDLPTNLPAKSSPNRDQHHSRGSVLLFQRYKHEIHETQLLGPTFVTAYNLLESILEAIAPGTNLNRKSSVYDEFASIKRKCHIMYMLSRLNQIVSIAVPKHSLSKTLDPEIRTL
jgi:hypothetical protein